MFYYVFQKNFNNLAGYIMEEKRLDVICQFTTDALIIPMKIRIKDSDGVYQEYKIKAYKELPYGDDLVLPNGVHVKSHIRPFKCRIESFGKYVDFKMIYNAKEALWKIYPDEK